MTETPLKNQIIIWLKSYDYWFQYAGNRLLEGEIISTELIDSTYKLFKEDYGLQPIELERADIVFNEIAIDTVSAIGHLELQAIKEIENVNALASGQLIQINPALTIIYGGNGAGKSGYVRLLNNAFKSRGDKHILQNVFDDTPKGEPKCKFTFKSTSDPYDLQYPTRKDSPEFSRFSVFDTQSIKVHLEQDNKLNFTPIGFEVFDNVLELYESLRDKLQSEISVNSPANDFVNYFVNNNEIRNVILKLGADSNEDEIRALSTFTEEDGAKLAALVAKREELKELDIPRQIVEHQKLESQFLEFISRQQALLDSFKPSDVEQYEKLINNYWKFKALTKEEGIASLEKYSIAGLGSNEWREFINASKKYSLVIEAERKEAIYPSDKDNCLFCLQPLRESESHLIQSYWSLLRSESGKELGRLNNSIIETQRKLRELLFVKFDEGTTYFKYTKLNNPELAEKWREIVKASETTRGNANINFANRNLDLPMTSFSVSVREFDEVISKLKESIQDFFQQNPAKELAELELLIRYLTDKSLLNKLLEKIIAFVSAHRWAKRAENALSALNTKSVTIKQGELFTSYITEKYTDKFNSECLMLNAPKIVNIVQRNAKISTLRKLQVAGVVANSVLSEGEQRAISLADFLTEVELNPNNIGVFFDDPITSQDHHRRERIAERLVDLAKQKQVVIFTHDIAFFVRLKILAETIGINHTVTTIRNSGGTPGLISPDLPWIAQNVKGRIGILKDRLVRLKKIEKEGDPDNYLFAVKTWYILLREAWERAVEERLFKGVVERFLLGIQTQKLKKVIVTTDLLSEIEKGMTDSSNWLHDAASGLNPTPPDTARAERDLAYFESFTTKCVPA